MQSVECFDTYSVRDGLELHQTTTPPLLPANVHSPDGEVEFLQLDDHMQHLPSLPEVDICALTKARALNLAGTLGAWQLTFFCAGYMPA